MREIKFRVWDASVTRMYFIDLFDSDRMQEWGAYLGHKPDIELMQFTGLKDRNGRDIFEGDIIEYRKIFIYGTPEGIKKTAEVKWFETRGMWRADGHELGEIVGGKMLDIGGGSTGCEVIGNIYENPDLLTTKQDSDPKSS